MSLYSKAAVFASFFVRKSSAPTGNEAGLVTRNIPSGIQQVTITNQTPGTPLNYFNQITAVAISSTEEIISYTALAGHTTTLYKVDVSGENIATYDIYINSASVARRRTYFGSSLGDTIDFGPTGYAMNPGDVLSVQVTNYRPAIANFESRIQLVQT